MLLSGKVLDQNVKTWGLVLIDNKSKQEKREKDRNKSSQDESQVLDMNIIMSISGMNDLGIQIGKQYVNLGQSQYSKPALI